MIKKKTNVVLVQITTPSNKLEQEVFKKVNEKYGEYLENQIEDRIKTELSFIDAHYNQDEIVRISNYVRSKKKRDLVVPRFSLSNSLVFYLLGIGTVNPLPRHNYCPRCHSFNWGHRVGDQCEYCGENLVEDGYNLPYELLFDDLLLKKTLLNYSVSSKSITHDQVVKFVESDMLKLARELGLKQNDIEGTACIENINEVIKCLNKKYYSRKYKKSEKIFPHRAFIGLHNLGSEVIGSLIEKKFVIKSFDELVRVICLSHGAGVMQANFNYILSPEPYTINDLIVSREDLFNILKTDLNTEDLTLMCRETRWFGKEHLSSIVERKLSETGIEQKFIDFLKYIDYVFYLGHVVAHTKIEILLAKIFLNNPVRYYKAFFKVNKVRFKNIELSGDIFRRYVESKAKETEVGYLAAIDLIERGYNPKMVLEEHKVKKEKENLKKDMSFDEKVNKVLDIVDAMPATKIEDMSEENYKAGQMVQTKT